MAVDPLPPWDDSPNADLDDKAATTMEARVLPSGAAATELELVGKCPRCDHGTRWTHPLRQVAGETPQAAATAEQVESYTTPVETTPAQTPPPTEEETVTVTAQCACGYKHDQRPEGEHGCGAPFTVAVRWTPSPDSTTATVHVTDELTTAFGLADARDLDSTRGGELADVRKAAESWRTALAALLAVLTATLFIKGKSSIDDIDHAWRWLVIVPLVLAGLFAIRGAWQAIHAAYGEPEDVWLSGRKGIKRFGSLSAWHHAFAAESVRRLKIARRMTAASLALVGVAIVATWLVPGPPPPAYVSATFTGLDAPVCGVLTKFDEGKVVIQKDKEHETRRAVADLQTLKVVKSCP